MNLLVCIIYSIFQNRLHHRSGSTVEFRPHIQKCRQTKLNDMRPQLFLCQMRSVSNHLIQTERITNILETKDCLWCDHFECQDSKDCPHIFTPSTHSKTQDNGGLNWNNQLKIEVSALSSFMVFQSWLRFFIVFIGEIGMHEMIHSGSRMRGRLS